MIGFYRGFEKRSSKSGIGKKITDTLMGPIRALKGSTKDNVSSISRQGAEGASDVFVRRFKDQILPELNKAIDKAKAGPYKVSPDLSKMTTLKGGILPALAVGGAFEGGRQGVKGMASLFKKPKEQKSDTVK